MRQPQEPKSTVWSYGKKLLTGTVALGATWLGYHYLSSLFETPVDRIDIVDAANDELLTLTSEMNVGMASLPAGSRHLLAAPNVIIPIPDHVIQIGNQVTINITSHFTDIDGDIEYYDAETIWREELSPSWIDFGPTLTNVVSTGWYSHKLDIVGNKVYIAEVDRGLKIVDLSNSPSLVGSYTTPSAQDVQVVGDFAYIPDYANGLVILNVTTPAAITSVTAFPTISNAKDIKIVGNLAYMAILDGGIEVINIADPTTPVSLGSFNTAGTALGVDVVGNQAYIADGIQGLRILDVTTPSSITELGSYNNSAQAHHVQVINDIAYVAYGLSGLQLFNVSDATTPVLLGGITFQSSTEQLFVSNNFAYLASVTAFQIVEISDPTSPKLLAHKSVQGVSARGIFFVNDQLFVADGYSNLEIYDWKDWELLAKPKGNDVSSQNVRIKAVDSAANEVSQEFELVADQVPFINVPISDRTIFPNTPYVNFIANDVAFSDVDQQWMLLRSYALPSWLSYTFPEPIPISTFSTVGMGSIETVFIQGNIAYLADYSGALLMVDISNPAAPFLVGTYTSQDQSYDVFVVDKIAYLADGSTGLDIVDVSNMASPVSLGKCVAGGGVVGVKVKGNTAFVGSQIGFYVYDVSDPANCVQKQYWPTVAHQFDIEGDYAFLANAKVPGKLEIIDINTLTIIGSYPTPSFTFDVEVIGNKAYLSVWGGGLQIIDVSNPAVPSLLGQSATHSSYYIAMQGNVAFLPADKLYIFDITDPTTPVELNAISLSCFSPLGVAVKKNIAYVACRSAGLEIIDLSRAKFLGNPTAADAGNYQITIGAIDELYQGVNSTFTLTVQGPPLQKQAIPNLPARAGQSFNYFVPQGTFEDPNKDTLSFIAKIQNGNPLPPWLSFNGISAIFSGLPQTKDVGLYNITIIVSDSVVGTDDIQSSFQLLVNQLTDVTANAGQSFSFQIPASTFNMLVGPLTYTVTLENGDPLPAWLSFEATSLTLSGTPGNSNIGQIAVKIVARDTNNNLYPALFNVDTTGNLPPIVLNTLSSGEATVLSNFRRVVPTNTFSDPNQDTLIYSAQLAGGGTLPSWLYFDGPTRTFSGKPGRGDTDTYADRLHAIEVTADDGQFKVSTTFNLAVKGASHLELGIRIGAPTISALGLVVGLWAKRAVIMNRCKKSRYIKQDDDVVIGEDYERGLEVPREKVKRVRVLIKGEKPSSFFGKVSSCFSYNREVDSGALLSWLTYNEGQNSIVSTRPLEKEDIGNYIVQVEGKAGVLKESFEIHVIKSSARNKKKNRSQSRTSSHRVYPEEAAGSRDSAELLGSEMRSISSSSGSNESRYYY